MITNSNRLFHFLMMVTRQILDEHLVLYPSEQMYPANDRATRIGVDHISVGTMNIVARLSSGVSLCKINNKAVCCSM